MFTGRIDATTLPTMGVNGAAKGAITTDISVLAAVRSPITTKRYAVTARRKFQCESIGKGKLVDSLTDHRDRTIFVEHFSHWEIPYVITSIWFENGKLESFITARDFATSKR